MDIFCDYLIVGAGVIGLTLARELIIKNPDAKIIVLEKEKSIGMHASGRNSGVLHTGIYYPANTLKSKFCKLGADLLFQYANEHDISVRKDGKIIVATSEDEISGLDQLLLNAQANNIHAEKVDGVSLREIEPFACSDFGGIHCRDTAVIDSQHVLRVLLQELMQYGVNLLFGKKIESINDDTRELRIANEAIKFGTLINTAGSYADSVAKLVNVGMEYILIPFKGTYYQLADEINHRVRASIYPVPNRNLPFLGVHFTRVIGGDVYIGPTVIPAFGRENYRLFQNIDVSESVNIMRHLIKLYIKNTHNFRGLSKVALSHQTKRGVVNSARSLMPGLETSSVINSTKVGIRPQLLNTKNMTLEMDFLIKKGNNSVHVLNSISPAFTSSFAVAKYLVNEVITG